MSTDDRDIESSNPSKNFKVGEFDQRSGFFTPVWESKRRIRSEPPPPSSKSAADSASSSPSKPASLPPGSAGAPSTRAAAGAASPESSSASAGAIGGPRKAGAGVPRPRAPSDRPRSDGGRSDGKKAAAKAAESTPPAAQHDPQARAVVLPPAVAAVFNAAPEPAAEAPEADTPAVHRSLDASLSGGQRRGAGKTPSAAARALESAGPDLPPAAFLDEEPDFRPPLAPSVPRPPRADRPALQQRALRASAAATRVHEQLKAKLQAEAAEIAENRYELEPETNRTPLQELELRGELEPFPLSSLRHLRRTLRLSTPVPESIRSLFSKYDRG